VLTSTSCPPGRKLAEPPSLRPGNFEILRPRSSSQTSGGLGPPGAPSVVTASSRLSEEKESPWPLSFCLLDPAWNSRTRPLAGSRVARRPFSSPQPRHRPRGLHAKTSQRPATAARPILWPRSVSQTRISFPHSPATNRPSIDNPTGQSTCAGASAR